MKSRGDTGDFYESAIGCSNKYVRYVGRFSNIKYRRSASIYIQNRPFDTDTVSKTPVMLLTHTYRTAFFIS